MANVGNLDIVISADTKRMVAAIEQGNKSLKGMEKEGSRLSAAMARHTSNMGKVFAVAGVGIAAFAAKLAAGQVGQIISGLNKAADSIDRLGKVAKRLGADVGQLSNIRFAAEEAGVEFDKLATFSAKAAKEISELVAKGQRTLQLGSMVVKLTDAQGRVRSITELLPELGRGLETVGNAADQLRLAEKLFGRGGGAEFVGFLRDGGKFLGTLNEQAERNRRLGGLVTDVQVKRATDLRDAVGRVQKAWENFKVAIVTEIAPPVTAFMDGLAESIGKINRAIPQLSQAVGRWFSKLQTPEEAALFADLRQKLGGFVSGLASDAGDVVGTSFVAAIETGFAALAPKIGDMLRDAVAPVLNSLIAAIPGAESVIGNFAASPTKQLETARANLDNARLADDTAVRRLRALREIEALKAELASPETPVNRRGWAEAELDGWRRVLAQLPEIASPELAKLEAKLKEAQDNFSKSQAERAKTLEETYRESITKIALSADRLGANTAANGAALEESIANITAFYTKLEPVTTDAGKRVAGLVTWYQSLTATTRTALQTMKQFAADVKSGDARIPQLSVPGGIAGFNQAMQARSLRADGNDRAADRIKLEVQQAMELRKLVDQLGVRGYAQIAAMAQVQVKEMAAFEMKPLRDLEGKLANLDRKAPEAVAKLVEELEKLKALKISGALDDDEFLRRAASIEDAMKDLEDAGASLRENLAFAIQGFAGSASDAFADLVVDGKASFADLAKSWSKALISMATQQMILQPIFNSLAGIVGGGIAPGRIRTGYDIGPARPDGTFAFGAAFTKGVQAFAAGGVVAKPTYFPMAGNRRGLMGEAGPEGILPLERIGGKLGVNARGGGVTVQVIDQRSSGARVQTSTQQGPDGQKTIRILIRDEIKGAVADGSLDRIMGTAYGLNRRPGTR